MKTSNYIITAFLTFLFGGVLVMAVAAKFHQDTNNDDGKLFAEDKKLEPFSVIVAEPGANFQISTAENPRIRSFYRQPDSSVFPPYSVRNDTLFVLADTTTSQYMNNIIIYGRNIKSIISKGNTNLDLRDFIITGEDTLLVKLNKANVNMFFDALKNQNAGLHLEAQESDIYINGSRLKTMNVKTDKSKIHTWNTSFGHLSGTIKNNSELYTNVMEKITVSVDSTSRFNISK